MPYLTLDDAKQYLGVDVYESAYDDVTNPGTPNDVILQEDIDAQTALIDSYLMRIYNPDTPITGTNALNILKDISQKLLLAKAYERYSMSEVPDWVAERYDKAIFRLKDIMSGDLPLNDEIQNPANSPFNSAFVSQTSSGQGRVVFPRNRMVGY